MGARNREILLVTKEPRLLVEVKDCLEKAAR